MAVETNFSLVHTGQDIDLVGTVIGSDGNATTSDISGWTFICEVRATWGNTTTIYSNTTPTVDNTLKTVTFRIPKASTQDVTHGNCVWQIRRTGANTERVIGYGVIPLGAPPASGKIF